MSIRLNVALATARAELAMHADEINVATVSLSVAIAALTNHLHCRWCASPWPCFTVRPHLDTYAPQIKR